MKELFDVKREVRRKILHLLGGVTIAVLVFYEWINPVSLGILVILALGTVLYSKHKRIAIIEWLMDKLERQEIRTKFPGRGLVFYLIGCELCIIFFSKDIAIASILILAVGDSVPNIVGMQFRSIKHPFHDKKYMEGVIAGIILSFLVTLPFLQWYEAALASTLAIFLEGLDMKVGLDKIDDNLIVPLYAGITVYILRFFFG